MKNYKYTKCVIGLGLNDKNSRRQEIETGAAFGILQNMLCSRFYGATVVNASGIYTHADDGGQVCEASYMIVLYFVNRRQVCDFAGELCRVFNQESVTIEATRRGLLGDRLTVEFFSPGE